jgi:hypothetical protein
LLTARASVRATPGRWQACPEALDARVKRVPVALARGGNRMPAGASKEHDSALESADNNVVIRIRCTNTE